MTTFNELVDELYIVLRKKEQLDIFDMDINNLKQEIVPICKKILFECGYSVAERIKGNRIIKINNTFDLINFFYLKLSYLYPLFKPYRNQKKEAVIAKRFVEARIIANNCSKQMALSECAMIIDAVFENIDLFNFKHQITFDIFGQANMGWVTERALGILNKSDKKANEAQVEKTIATLEESYYNEEVEESNFGSLTSILNSLS